MNILEMVEELRVAANQEKNFRMSSRLIAEEYGEWTEEYHFKDNPEDELKELTDLVYVIFGYANSQGWDLNEAVKRVHENNMGRMYQPDGTIKRREDGKVLRNKEYPKVQLGDLV